MFNITVSLIAILSYFFFLLCVKCVFWEDVKEKLRELLCCRQLKISI